MEKQEKIGFHKGALDCLVKERAELIRLVAIVDSLIKLHVKALKDEGVDLEKEIKEKAGLEKETEELKSDNFTDFSKMIASGDEAAKK